MVNQAVLGGHEYLYVTDAPVSKPWDQLPTFWDALLAAF